MAADTGVMLQYELVHISTMQDVPPILLQGPKLGQAHTPQSHCLLCCWRVHISTVLDVLSVLLWGPELGQAKGPQPCCLLQITSLLEELQAAAAAPLLSRSQLSSLAERIRCAHNLGMYLRLGFKE